LTFWVRILRWVFKLQRAAYLHRRYSLSFFALIVLLVGWASQDVRNSNDPLLFFSENNVYRQKLEALQQVFGDAQTTVIVLDANVPDAPLKLLEAERYLSEILMDPSHDLYISHNVGVGSVTATLPAIGYPVEHTSLEDLQFLAQDHPALRTYFFNDDLSAVLLFLPFKFPDQSDPALMAAYAQQMDIVAHMQKKFPTIDTSISGSVTTFEALRAAFAGDKRFLFPATVLINFLVLLFAFGNLRVTLSALLIAVVSVVLTQGVAGWSGYVFAAGSASSFSIVLTLTVASLIHVVHAMGQRQRSLPFQRSGSIILASFRKLTVPVTLAHITTAVGFLSLNWADAPAFKSMGNLVAIGLIFSLMLSLFVAPIALKSKRNKLVIKDDNIRKISRWFANAWAAAPVRNGVLVCIFSMAALSGLTQIVFDDQITANFPDDHELVVNIDKMNEAFGWVQTVDIVLRYDGDELTQPQAFEDIEKLSKWIVLQSPVHSVLGPLPLIRDCLARRTPPILGSFKDVAPKALNYCVRTSGGNKADGQAGFFDKDFQQLHLQVLLPRLSAAGVREISEKITAHVKAMGYAEGRAVVSGMAVMSAYLSEVNTYNMLFGTAMAMLIVSVLIGVFLRSTGLAILSILPNFLPAMAALGLWVWMNGTVGMAASIIASVTFGIVVDDTIHILYALARGKNTQTRAGVRTVLRNVTPGVLTTTATLGLGFAVLMFSGFEVNRQLGFLTSITIGIAFLFDIFVLPGLYSFFKGRKR